MESYNKMVNEKYNFTYRFVDIPNWQEVARRVEQSIPKTTLTQHGFLDIDPHVFLPVPGLISLIEFFAPLRNLRQFAIVNLLPGKTVDDFPIHIDNIDYPVVLNIPIYNCENVDTVFYKFKEIVELETFSLYTKSQRETHNYKLCPTHLMEKIDSFKLTQPAFINNWVPHTAVNLTNDRRTMFNIRFKKPIDPKFYS